MRVQSLCIHHSMSLCTHSANVFAPIMSQAQGQSPCDSNRKKEEWPLHSKSSESFATCHKGKRTRASHHVHTGEPEDSYSATTEKGYFRYVWEFKKYLQGKGCDLLEIPT